MRRVSRGALRMDPPGSMRGHGRHTDGPAPGAGARALRRSRAARADPGEPAAGRRVARRAGERRARALLRRALPAGSLSAEDLSRSAAVERPAYYGNPAGLTD